MSGTPGIAAARGTTLVASLEKNGDNEKEGTKRGHSGGGRNRENKVKYAAVRAK